ncbi:Protein csh3 [Malassezia cuniculi]|uniref:Protein csh3 n=1 Tax=Malassezia cuniculi TaxID=948313 RepID=A0AAF0ESD8_9BASI|nr:Protein csh3 [Malassezia cuniculi]
MGFRTGVIFAASTFDTPLLFTKFTEEQVIRAENFYVSIYNAPRGIPSCLHGVIGLGIIGIASKLHRWTETDLYFGLGSMILFVGATIMYIAVIWPNLRALANPTEAGYIVKAVFETELERNSNSFPPLTFHERLSVVQVVSATNIIIAALLFGVLLLQIGQWYVDRQHLNELNKRRNEQIAKLEQQRTQETRKTK